MRREEVVGEGTWRWDTVPPFDWIAFEKEVPTPSWTKVPGTESCTEIGLQGDLTKLYEM